MNNEKLYEILDYFSNDPVGRHWLKTLGLCGAAIFLILTFNEQIFPIKERSAQNE